MNKPIFLKVKPGDTVLVCEDEICQVLSFVVGSRDPDAPSLFQVANVDTGEIKYIHAAEVDSFHLSGRSTETNAIKDKKDWFKIAVRLR